MGVNARKNHFIVAFFVVNCFLQLLIIIKVKTTSIFYHENSSLTMNRWVIRIYIDK